MAFDKFLDKLREAAKTRKFEVRSNGNIRSGKDCPMKACCPSAANNTDYARFAAEFEFDGPGDDDALAVVDAADGDIHRPENVPLREKILEILNLEDVK